MTISKAALARKYDMIERAPMKSDHDNADAPNTSHLSEFKIAALSYIAGFVGKMKDKETTCVKCSEALGSVQNQSVSSFLTFKDRGGLFKPTTSVFNICKEAEKCFQRMLKTTYGELPQSKGISDAISYSVLAGLNLSNIFRELDNHMTETAIEDNHIFALIKRVAKNYCKVRLYHLGKQYSEKLSSTKVRKKLSKLVLFNHQ